MGAHVLVTEVDPLAALEAVMDGFPVVPMAEAARRGEVFVTVTGNRDVIRREHFEVMRDGAVLANAGHFDVEIDVAGLRALSTRTRRVREHVEEFTRGEWLVRAAGELAPQVYPVPEEIDRQVAALKLEAMGVRIDQLTPEQRRYLESWEEGT